VWASGSMSEFLAAFSRESYGSKLGAELRGAANRVSKNAGA